MSNWLLLSGTVILFFFGLIVNNYFPTDFFILKSILLLAILNILIFSLRHYNTHIVKEFIRTSEDPVLSAEKLKMKNGIFANYNIVISLILCVFFITVSIYLRFIHFDITGFFSLVLLFTTIFLSIIGYMLYVHQIYFLYRLSKADIEKYSKFYPAYTRWLVNITKFISSYQNAFFISGTLYVILFTIHAPNDTLRIFSFKSVYSNQDVVLLTAWIVIILAVLVGFPITSYLKSQIIRDIVSNLKIKSSEYYESVVDRVEISKQMDYIKLIKEIMESADYPIKTRFNIFVSSTTMILNLIIAIQKIFPNAIRLNMFM